MSDARYPIGKPVYETQPTAAQRAVWIGQIAAAPAGLRAAVAGLADADFDRPYRPGGWTIREVLHHVPDSHINAYTRFKLALTEDDPVIRTYDEAAWARVADTARTPPEVSLALLDALHRRWTTLLEAMTEEEYRRPLRHPERGRMTLDDMLQLYAWHGRHHAAHISTAREREGF